MLIQGKKSLACLLLLVRRPCTCLCNYRRCCSPRLTGSCTKSNRHFCWPRSAARTQFQLPTAPVPARLTARHTWRMAGPPSCEVLAPPPPPGSPTLDHASNGQKPVCGCCQHCWWTLGTSAQLPALLLVLLLLPALLGKVIQPCPTTSSRLAGPDAAPT